MIPVAALFVETNGVYADLPGVELWDEERDARRYNGPHPVVAHPPCARWGRYWRGSPSGKGPRFSVVGQDEGCFASARASVRRWGGVLEHPRNSLAWLAYALPTPNARGGWSGPDDHAGYSCQVDQGHYGHRAPKPTWLYFVSRRHNLPELRWGPSQSSLPPQVNAEARGRGSRSPNDAIERMSRKQRLATPLPFRDLLLSLARSTR